MLHGALLFLLSTAPLPGPDSVVAFVNVTVIPMDRERTVPGQTVVVRGDRIVAMGPADQVKVPAGGLRVDGRGKFLMPGLAEMHAHIPGGQEPESVVEHTLFLYVSGGITTIRGMLGHPRHLELRERAARGELISPAIYTSGPSFNGNSVSSPAVAAQMVADQKKAGYDFLKIHPGVTREAFDTLAATAQRVGIRFAGHVPLAVGLPRALEARYATIDHLDGYVEAMVRLGAPVSPAESKFFGLNLGEHLDETRLPGLVEATRKAGVWNVPTQTLMENLAGAEGTETIARRPEMRYVSVENLSEWAELKNSLLQETGSSPGSARRTMDVRRKLIKALHAGGAGLLLGSDAPQIYNVPGFSVHRELQSLVAAGLTPYQALETGTRNIAVFFGTSATNGTVQTGKRADLILLDGNPLSDVRNTTRRAGVMLAGRWLPRSAIDERLDAIAKSMAN
jgi:imidazolonepropionase-like amidohydrolase